MCDPDKVVGYVVYYEEDGCASGAFVHKGRSTMLWMTIEAMKQNRPRSEVWVKSVENIPIWVDML